MKKRLLFIDGLVWLVTLDLDHWKELEMKRVQISQLYESSKNYWWDFMKHIAEALVYADSINAEKLINAFEKEFIHHLSLNWIE